MKLKFVYKGDKCYSAQLDIIEGVGMVSIWEEPEHDCFILMPTKLVHGCGEVVDKNRSLQILKKSDGWEGVYETGQGIY